MSATKRDAFELESTELSSRMWSRIKQHLIERLTHLRELNDNVQPDEKTDQLRGRIAEVKRLLRLGDPQP